MKCPHCKGMMEHQHDRVKCLICGRSQWGDFAIKKPLKSEMNGAGCPTGSRAQGSDNIKGRI